MIHPGKLYLIPTVLSENTADKVLSPQIKEVVSNIDYFFVEELRTARRFISALKIGKPIESLKFFELNKDTTADAFQKDIESLPKGVDIGVISEAGCPGIADPGAMAVAYAHKTNMDVLPLVGPSSILLALMGSGFNGQSFCFHGYLPIDKAEKIKVIKSLEKESKTRNQTQIFMETPYRNMKMLEEILPVLNAETRFCIASGLTSESQYIKTKKVKDWPKFLPDIHKRPTIFLLQA
ncbi:MAG TPA: SAM-dependent methyltransferase [Cytophagaceae bacterium]|jgi:16S rRNA (cytidine1402-2'-O)-methyltransferase|nr:SAM-dependent methyltransferase [Cytophagaceae bacterium]